MSNKPKVKPKPPEKPPKDPPKKPKVKYTYPAEALAADDPLGRVIFFGRKFRSDERDALINATIDMSIDQVSQVEFKFSDPGWQHLAQGIYQPDIPVTYEDLLLDVATVETGSEEGSEVLDVKCRPRIVRQLKKRKGIKVIKDASPTEFIKSECKELGIKVIAQDSAKRKQVSRDVKREKGDYEPPSSWTTFKRLADEIGFSMFEAANVLYFGKPKWLMERQTDELVVGWRTGEPHTQALLVPECDRNEDDEENMVNVKVRVQSNYGRTFRPGMVMRLKGMPTFNGRYLVKSVTFSLLIDDYVDIEAGTPVNPGQGKVKSTGDGAGGGKTTSSMRFLMQRVGFRDDDIEVAMAVAMATSGGDSKKEDKTDTGTKWGPYVGLFQVRSLRKPDEYTGGNKRRIKGKLLDAEFNAEFIFDLTKKGKDWSMLEAFTNGSYKKFYKKKKDYTVIGWVHKLPQPPPTGDGSATGARSASSFVTYALRQTGDAYVYGASPSGSNPTAFDCSALVQWAAGQCGVSMPRTSGEQINACTSISVDQAIRTRGAILWHEGHVAISLGNGRTIEAANPGFGVGSQNAAGRFARGGLIKGLRY